MTLKMLEVVAWIEDVSLKMWKATTSCDSSWVVHSTSTWVPRVQKFTLELKRQGYGLRLTTLEISFHLISSIYEHDSWIL